MLATGTLTLFISNAATALMMLPVALALISEVREKHIFNRGKLHDSAKAILLAVNKHRYVLLRCGGRASLRSSRAAPSTWFLRFHARDDVTVLAVRASLAEGARLVRLTAGVDAPLDWLFSSRPRRGGAPGSPRRRRHSFGTRWKRERASDLRARPAPLPVVPRPSAFLPGEAPVGRGAEPSRGRRRAARSCSTPEEPRFARLRLDAGADRPAAARSASTTRAPTPTERARPRPLHSRTRRAPSDPRDAPGCARGAPHRRAAAPWYPAASCGRSLEEPGLAPVELLWKSRVDWLLEAEGPVDEALALAEREGSVLHVYLVRFESFDPATSSSSTRGPAWTTTGGRSTILRELAARFPRRFEYRAPRARIVAVHPLDQPEGAPRERAGDARGAVRGAPGGGGPHAAAAPPGAPAPRARRGGGAARARVQPAGEGPRRRAGLRARACPGGSRIRRLEAICRVVARALARGPDAEPRRGRPRARDPLSTRWPGHPGHEEVPRTSPSPPGSRPAARPWARAALRGRREPGRGVRPRDQLLGPGAKRAALKEGVPAGRRRGSPRRTERWASRRGRPAPRPRWARPATRTARRRLRDRRRRARRGRARRGGGRAAAPAAAPDAAAAIALGALMGYPTCCVEAFAGSRTAATTSQNERAPSSALRRPLASPRSAASAASASSRTTPARRRARRPSRSRARARPRRHGDAGARPGPGGARRPVLFVDYDRASSSTGRSAATSSWWSASVASSAPPGSVSTSPRRDSSSLREGSMFTMKGGAVVARETAAPLLVVPGEPLHPSALAAYSRPDGARGGIKGGSRGRGSPRRRRCPRCPLLSLSRRPRPRRPGALRGHEGRTARRRSGVRGSRLRGARPCRRAGAGVRAAAARSPSTSTSRCSCPSRRLRLDARARAPPAVELSPRSFKPPGRRVLAELLPTDCHARWVRDSK